MENLKQLKMSFRFFNTFYFKFLVFIIELFQAAFLLVFFFGLLATAKLRYSQQSTVLWVLKMHSLSLPFMSGLRILQSRTILHTAIQNCYLSTLEARLPVSHIRICFSYLALVWLTKKGDIRYNGSGFQSKKGGRPQSRKNSSGPSRRCWSRTCPKPFTATTSPTSTTSPLPASKQTRRGLK